MSKALTFLGLLAFAAFVAGSPVEAQSTGEHTTSETQARALFERALSLADQGRDAEAADAFERSFGLVARASTALNWAIVLQRLGKGREALRALDGFESQRIDASEQDISDANALRVRLRSLLATLTLRVAPEAARVEVDGRAESAEGAERLLVLDPGPHVLRVDAEGFVPRRIQLTARAGEELSERVQLEAIAPTEVALPDTPSQDAASPELLRQRRVRRGVGIGAALLAVVVTVIVVVVTRPDGPDGGNTNVVLRPFEMD